MIPEHPAPGNEAQRAHPSTLPHVGPRGAAMQGQGVQGGGGGVEELEAHLSKLKLATSVHQISMEPHRCAAYALSYVICPIVKSRGGARLMHARLMAKVLSYRQVSGWSAGSHCARGLRAGMYVCLCQWGRGDYANSHGQYCRVMHADQTCTRIGHPGPHLVTCKHAACCDML